MAMVLVSGCRTVATSGGAGAGRSGEVYWEIEFKTTSNQDAVGALRLAGAGEGKLALSYVNLQDRSGKTR